MAIVHTHRDYFNTFRLNVEQYGEIVVARAFGGEKVGDAQPGYDIECPRERVLLSIGREQAEFLGANDPVRIEVKSKLAETKKGGRANVIHCRNTNFGAKGMTHLVVVLVEERGDIVEAWLLTANHAEDLRTEETKSRYIPVKAVRASTNAVSIKGLLNQAANEDFSSQG